jgi:hypothetical protein
MIPLKAIIEGTIFVYKHNLFRYRLRIFLKF